MKYNNLTPLDKGEVLSESEALAQLAGYKQQQQPTILPNYIHLKDILSSTGESYKDLWVAKDIIRDEPDPKSPGTIWPIVSWTHIFSKHEGCFLASLPLTFTILQKCYGACTNTQNSELESFLHTYLDHSPNIQNTLVDWENDKIIHYPKKDDFPYLRDLDNANLQSSNRHARYYSDVIRAVSQLTGTFEYKTTSQYLKDFICGLTHIAENSLLDLSAYLKKPILIPLVSQTEPRIKKKQQQ